MEDGEIERSRSGSRNSRSGVSNSDTDSRSRFRSRTASRSRSRSRSKHSRDRSRGRNRSRGARRTRRRSPSEATGSVDRSAAIEEAALLWSAGVVKLCAEHTMIMVPLSCVTCRLVSRAVKPDVLSELLKLASEKVEESSEIPSTAARFSARIDEKVPTLHLAEGDMALAESIFSRGKMSPSSMFDELTKEFLFLPQSQNEILTKSVQLEKMLLKYKQDKSYSHVFHYVEQLGKMAKHLRIAERPIILAMGELTRIMNSVKQHGKDLGFLYPSKGPLVQLMGPRKFNDMLHYSQLPVIPLPFLQLATLLEGVSLTEPEKAIIANNMLAGEATTKEYMRDVSNKIGSFMDTVVGGANRLDYMLGFHMDLYGHCDGELTDLMRDKASTLFSPNYRSAVKGGVSGHKAGENIQAAGLLGGEMAVRDRLSEATKSDELLAKTLNKPYKKGGRGRFQKGEGK